MRDVNGDPVPNCDCLLAIAGEDRKLVTNGEGRIDEEIPVDTKSGEIRIRGQVYKLDIGHLDPVRRKAGSATGSQTLVTISPMAMSLMRRSFVQRSRSFNATTASASMASAAARRRKL